MINNRVKIVLILIVNVLGCVQRIDAAAERIAPATIRVWLVNPEEHTKAIQRNQQQVQAYIDGLPKEDKFRKPFQASFDNVIAQLPIRRKLPEDVKEERAACVEVVDVGEHHEQGKRETMEDASIIDRNLQLYAVFDGHGGSQFSQFAQRNFVDMLKAVKKKYNRSAVSDQLREAVELLEKGGRKHRIKAGSTALVVQVTPEFINIANTGDSRAILVRGGGVSAHTEDHKPNDPDEKKRIQKAGNEIVDGRLGGFAVARSVGDYTHKDALAAKYGQSALIAEPSVYQWPYQDGDVLVLACDGLWDVVKNENAAHFINRQREKGMDAPYIAEQLVLNALKMGSTDNVSALVIIFGPCE